jgi:uncharacterized protein
MSTQSFPSDDPLASLATSALPPPRLAPAAVLYTPDTPSRSALARFVAKQKERGWRVGGIMQEVMLDENGTRLGADAIEIDTGRHIAIARPTPSDREHGNCPLDDSALAEATEALRRAIASQMDLIVVEKLGDRERKGEGLIDEILTAMAEGIPTLVAVPTVALDDWSRLCGELGVLLPSDEAALWRWWGPHRLYGDLVLGVDASDKALRVVIGVNWTLVEGPHGCGLAMTPQRQSAACKAFAGTESLTGQPLQKLAAMIHSWDPFNAAIGLAAINAHYNRFDLDGGAENGLDCLEKSLDPVTIVGRFPSLDQHFNHYRVIERRGEYDPENGEFPESAAAWLLPESEGVVITSSSLIDHSLPNLLSSCHQTAALVGPGTPLSSRLFDYGLNILSGLVIEDVDGVANAIAEGGATKDIKRYARHLSLKAP